MTGCPAEIAAIAFALIAAAGIVQCLVGVGALRQFRRRATPAGAGLPAVTILKPLHGDEPLLEAALASCCRQDYPCFQIVGGVQSAADPALRIVRRLQRQFPGVPMAVAVDRTLHGANRKIGNLINMLSYAEHQVLVVADSDMHVAPDYLHSLVVALQQPGIGLVTTLYSGLPATETVTARLGAAQINHAFLPGALLARLLGRQDCLGATMALRRETLERIGGFHALADHLADDAVLGRLVRALGLRVGLAGTVPATTVPETEMQALFEHELRWARTVKSVAPVGFVLSAMQYPLFWAALATGVSGGAVWAWSAFGLAWAVRIGAAMVVDRDLKVTAALTIWYLPFRDLLSMMVMIASYRTRRVAWRGQVLLATRPRLASEEG